MTTTDYAIQLAELVIRHITDVQINGCQAIETRVNPADYDELVLGMPFFRPVRLWGLPLKADAKVPVGSPRVLAKACK